MTHIERGGARAPDNVRFVYTYAVSLYSTGKAREAIAVLEKALRRRPNDRDVLIALVTFNRDQGASDQALRYAERMAAQYPDDPEAQRLVAQLRARSPADAASRSTGPSSRPPVSESGLRSLVRIDGLGSVCLLSRARLGGA